MQLRLLGILQDIGYEDAYLHVSVPDNKLFVEIAKNNYKPGMSKSLFMSVSAVEIVEYFDMKIGFKEMVRNANICYVINKRHGKFGRFRRLNNERAVKYFDDVDMFDEDFCSQKQLILYYINKLNK